jgi:hypothetical protein
MKSCRRLVISRPCDLLTEPSHVTLNDGQTGLDVVGIRHSRDPNGATSGVYELSRLITGRGAIRQIR